MAGKSVTQRRVQAQGWEIEYQLERKAVKNWNLRIRRDGSVYLSAPRGVPAAQLDEFVRSKAQYIRKAQDHFQEVQARESRPRLHDASVFQEVLDQLYPLLAPYGVAYPQLRLREMKSRWGSCLVGKGVVTLNKGLLAAPRGCIEYVAVHELCHFLHPDHSQEFYQLLSRMMPDWKARRELLNRGVPGAGS